MKSKGSEGLITVCKYLRRGAVGSEDKARPFSLVSSDRTRGNGLKVKYKKSHLNIRKIFYCLGNHTQEQVAPSSCGVAILGDVQKLPAHSPDQPALMIMLWAGHCTRRYTKPSNLNTFLILQMRMLSWCIPFSKAAANLRQEKTGVNPTSTG